MCERACVLPTDNSMKYFSLVTLTVQNAALGLCTRHVRTRPGDMFLSTAGEWRTSWFAKTVLTSETYRCQEPDAILGEWFIVLEPGNIFLSFLPEVAIRPVEMPLVVSVTVVTYNS